MDLFYITLSTSFGKGLRLWCSEVITALEGQAHKKHFQKETAKIQGCSVQLLDSFFFLIIILFLDKNI